MSSAENSSEKSLDSPDLVDFGRRESYAIQHVLEKFPYIRTSKYLFGDFRVMYIPRAQIHEVFEELGDNYLLPATPIIMGLMGQRELDASGVTEVRQSPYLGLDGRGTLMGFVDTGIDYTNRIFQTEDGDTKVKVIWDQTIPGNPPADFEYGTIYEESQINKALQAQNPFDLVPHRDTVGHGTFLASVTSGGGKGHYTSVAPGTYIIAVKLRKANAYHYDIGQIPPSQENAYSSNDVMMGIEFIVERAKELQMPVSICVCMGSNEAGHDGSNYFEEYLGRIGELAGVTICAAAGNEAASGRHAQGHIDGPGGAFSIDIQCGESARNSKGIMVAIWNSQMDRLSASITSPLGEQIPKIEARPGVSYESHLVLDPSVVIVRYFFPHPRTGSQLTLVRIFAPTPGIWRITMYGDIILDGSFHAWLSITGFCDPTIRFVNPSVNNTITLPGTAQGIITVGAYDAETSELYENSSCGPTRYPALAPDFTAPGVNVLGSFPDGYGAMSGAIGL